MTGRDGPAWELLRIEDTQVRARLPRRLPATLTEQALHEEGERIMLVLLEALMWANLPS